MNRYKLTRFLWVRDEVGFFFYLFMSLSCLMVFNIFFSLCSVEYNVSYVYHAMFAYFDRNCQEGREKQE